MLTHNQRVMPLAGSDFERRKGAKSKRCVAIAFIVVGLAISFLTVSRIAVAAAPMPISLDDSVTYGVNSFTYTGKWVNCTGCRASTYPTSFRYAYTTDAKAVFSFTGTQVTLYGYRGALGGIATVSIDGKRAVDVNYYDASQTLTAVYNSGALDFGKHTATIIVSGRKTLAAGGTAISIDRAEVFGSNLTTTRSIPVAQPAGSWVSISGSDANSGSQAAPFKTIQKALTVVNPGMTIHVLPGVYAGSLDILRGGTSSAWVTIRSEFKYAANIVGQVHIGHQYLRFEGFELTGPDVAVGIAVEASHSVVKGNKIHGLHQYAPDSNGGAGIDVYTGDYSGLHDITLEGNQVYNIGQSVGSNQLVQGIYVAIPCPACRIINNLVYQVSDFGIHAYHNPNGWIVANNTVFNNGRGILTGPNFEVVNNISVNNSDNYDIRGAATLSNNLSFGNGSAARLGVKVADPQFVDYQINGTGDYHLLATSPGLNNGTATNAPATDFDGTARPQGAQLDAGIFEQAVGATR